ncbi:hypothetical protein C8R47DRAFT_1208251 [Mycena vitilis]|nr:hypothetical protein C8R47DRAFT_1208251 [Mycena vitilis]
MTTPTSTLPTSASALKHMEKQIVKEAQMEASQVKHTLKAVDVTEKEVERAQKSVNKAEKQNAKLEKKEESAAKALNKATHKHEGAVSDLTNSERELKLKHQHDVRVQAELEAKKAQADTLVSTAKMHEDAREAKLHEIREATAVAVQGPH